MLAVVVLRAFGASGLPMWVAVLVFTGAIAKAVMAVTGSERPVRSLAALLAAEVSAPRPAPSVPQTTVFSTAAIAALTAAAPGARAGRNGTGGRAGRPA